MINSQQIFTTKVLLGNRILYHAEYDIDAMKNMNNMHADLSVLSD